MLARNALLASVASSARRFGDLELLDQLREPRRLIGKLALVDLELSRVCLECLFRGFALGDVAGGGVNDAAVRGTVSPSTSAIAACRHVEVTIFEVDDLLPGPSFSISAIVASRSSGMDELQERFREEVRLGVAEAALPRRIDASEVAVESGDAQHVERQGEEPIEFLLRPFPVDEQPDLVADAGERRQQVFVRRSDLAAEELHHAENLAA